MRRSLGRGAAIALLLAACAPAIAACGFAPGPPPLLAPGTQECIGMPLTKCQELLVQYSKGHAGPRTAFQVKCTVAPCTQQKGEAEVTIIWADGITTVGETSWGLGGP